MQWTTPDFEEVNLSGEVTAYVNTDDEVRSTEQRFARQESASALAETVPETSA